MGNEILEFAREIGATDLKEVFDYSEFHSLFKRPNYFLLGNDMFLIIKISRNKVRPFYGLGKAFLDFFNQLTEKSGNYFFVALASDRNGWILSKKEILDKISDGSLSYSEDQAQYKINNYNLKNHHSFASIEDFLKKVGHTTNKD
jgi:hypothetical protein